jgi:protein arginine N-methyltransferase 1
MATYSTASYGRMVSDRVRMLAYEAALRATVRPGAVVVELGTGTGVMACLAARLGARRVYAIEPSDAIQVAREVAAANGVADRITFIQAWSRDVELPEKAEVMVSDMRGVLPLFGRNLADVADARGRFLSADAVAVPLRDRIHAAPVEAPEIWARWVAPADAEAFGLDMGPARRAAADAWYQAHLGASQPLAAPREWASVDYGGAAPSSLAGELEWRVERDGSGHGLAVWFDAELAPGIGFSNAPAAPPALYGQAFFPWPEPVSLHAGDRVRARLGAHRTGDEWTWAWRTEVRDAEGGPVARFRQSNLRDALPSLERMRRGLATYAPRPGSEGEVLREVLARMDGERSVAGIAREVAGLFPGTFADADAALERVARISREWSL